MELLIMAYACKTSSAKSIVGVIPYLPYSKQCKLQELALCVFAWQPPSLGVIFALSNVANMCILTMLNVLGLLSA
jgi:phosphoribosylpyrophosphate synthetase